METVMFGHFNFLRLKRLLVVYYFNESRLFLQYDMGLN